MRFKKRFADVIGKLLRWIYLWRKRLKNDIFAKNKETKRSLFETFFFLSGYSFSLAFLKGGLQTSGIWNCKFREFGIANFRNLELQISGIAPMI